MGRHILNDTRNGGANDKRSSGSFPCEAVWRRFAEAIFMDVGSVHAVRTDIRPNTRSVHLLDLVEQ